MNSFTTSLHDEKTFSPTFIRDLGQCQREVIIERPFITSERMKTLWPTLRKLHNRGIKIFIATRDPKEHSEGYENQTESEIEALEAIGIQVLLCTGNHSLEVGHN
jgi:hypothetical protein